jgi:hypothetical protein
MLLVEDNHPKTERAKTESRDTESKDPITLLRGALERRAEDRDVAREQSMLLVEARPTLDG